MQDTYSRLRGVAPQEAYVLPNKLAGFFDLIVASSTRMYGPMRFEGNRKEEVIAHRRQFFKDTGARLEQAVFMDQVHGSTIAVVTSSDKGKGSEDTTDAIPSTDGLISNEPQLFLSVSTADCVPVMLYDQKLKVIACAHAGWKGTIARLPQQVVARMRKEFGSKSEDVFVYLGPGITNSCYDIDALRAKRFTDEFGASVVEARQGKLFLSLQQSIVAQLAQEGVWEKHIEISDICSACEHQRFPSHRIHKEARNDIVITTIGLRKR